MPTTQPPPPQRIPRFVEIDNLFLILLRILLIVLIIVLIIIIVLNRLDVL